MTTDVLTVEPAVAKGAEITPEVRRRRDDADRLWAIAAEHRALAEELEAGNKPDAFIRAKTQRLRGEVAAHHGFAYHELANAAEARARSKAFPRESPQWNALVGNSFAAIRRAEAHHERAAAYTARTIGNEAAARRHEMAAQEADSRATASTTGVRLP